MTKKLYILRPVKDLPDGDNPWKPWYDKSFGFIVSASTAWEARRLANDNAGDENRGNFLGEETAKTKSPWLNPVYSSCKLLTPSDKSEIIMQDFSAA